MAYRRQYHHQTSKNKENLKFFPYTIGPMIHRQKMTPT